MIAENTQTQMRKGILEYCILSIISKGEIYASDIISELKRAQLLVDEINIDRESISLTKNSFLDARVQFCESINKLFGLNTSCEFNVDLYPREFTDTRYENTNSSSLGKGGYRETIEKDAEERQKEEVE